MADRLAQSLHHAVPINLLQEKHPQEVQRLWDAEVKIGTQPSTPVPSDTAMITVFDEEAVAGKLLILGAPGAGKTTTLLELAQALVARAERDAIEPIPVLVSLSSWKDDARPIASWLVAELHLKYGLRKDIGQRWVDECCLLPLLDGLDELGPRRQERCVQALNRFQREYGLEHLVVCCRLAEYQDCPTKLHLNGAVHLQPLTDAQIHRYLVGAGRPDLWQLVQADPDLSALATSPLLLSMMTLTYEEGSIPKGQKPGSTPEHHQYLFDMYVEHMLSRGVNAQRFPKDKTLKWLIWLAQRLKDDFQTGFLIEKLQPFWLKSPTQKYMYHIGTMVTTALVVGLLFSLILWLFSSLPKSEFSKRIEETIARYIGDLGWQYMDQYMDLIVLTIIGLSAGLIVGLRGTITPIETLKWSGAGAWREMRRGLQRWAMTGLDYGAYAGLMAGLIALALGDLFTMGAASGSELAIWGKVGQVAGRLSGLTAAVTAVLTARPSVWLRGEFRERLSTRLPWAVSTGLMCGLGVAVGVGWRSGLAGVLIGLCTGSIAALSYGLSDRRVFRWVETMIVGLLSGLGGGVLSWLVGELLLEVLRLELAGWLHLWLLGGLGVGATAGVIAGLMAKLSEQTGLVKALQGARGERWKWPLVRWPQRLMIEAALFLMSGLGVVLLAELGQMQSVRASGLLTSMLGLGLIWALTVSLFFALVGAATGAFTAALLGALLGALSGGLTGPEIERRAAPNQGIRRSAINVGVFALIGGVALGLIWGLVNEAVGVLTMGFVRTAGDWWRIVLWNALFLGLFSGLVPGAACVQHFTLRFVLWCHGLAPWRYARFLDYATERMFLQRVGGRYRFIHDLLRDHFAAMEPKQVKRG